MSIRKLMVAAGLCVMALGLGNVAFGAGGCVAPNAPAAGAVCGANQQTCTACGTRASATGCCTYPKRCSYTTTKDIFGGTYAAYSCS